MSWSVLTSSSQIKLVFLLCFAGVNWRDKIVALRSKMAERKVLWFVATALDEVACKSLHLLSLFFLQNKCPSCLGKEEPCQGDRHL